MSPRSRKYDDLPVGWNVHPELTLRDNAQALPARCVPDLALQSRALALELVAFAVERCQALRLPDAEGSSPHNGQRD
jgi:hypothetical protein